MKTAVLYIRVSTDEQADKGYSQRYQEDALLQYCQINLLKVKEVVFEDHSAKSFSRPAWKIMLSDFKRKKLSDPIFFFSSNGIVLVANKSNYLKKELKDIAVILKSVDKKQEFDGRSFANIFHGYSGMDAVDKKHIAKLIPPFKPDFKTGDLS